MKSFSRFARDLQYHEANFDLKNVIITILQLTLTVHTVLQNF